MQYMLVSMSSIQKIDSMFDVGIGQDQIEIYNCDTHSQYIHYLVRDRKHNGSKQQQQQGLDTCNVYIYIYMKIQS